MQVKGAPTGLDGVLADFKSASSDQQRLRFLKQYAEQMPALPAELRTFENRVMGCTAQVCTWHSNLNRATAQEISCV